MRKILPLAAASLALIGAAPVATAAVPLGEYFSLSGFGTLGAVQTNSDQGKFGRDRQVGGANKTASFDVDSNFGLQVTGNATAWLSATAQLLVAKRDGEGIEPDIEWAFVTLKPVDGLSIRGGRMAAPMFLISDSRNVGYANTWVRAPNEVYALNVFRRMEGGDLTYRRSFGPIFVSATGFAGQTEFNALGGVRSEGKDLRGVNLQLEVDWATFRIGRASTKAVTPATNGRDPYTFTGIGVIVDRDNLIAQAEFVKRESEQRPDTVDADSWYVMGGYRFGKVLPYAIFSSTKPKSPNFVPLLSGTQKTAAIGMRWDALSAAAFKVQLERIDTDNSKGISFTTPVRPATPGARPSSAPVTKPVTALSIALDFTF